LKYGDEEEWEMSWTDHARKKKVLRSAKEEWNILHKKNRRKALWIGHVLRRKCLLKYIIEGKIGRGMRVTGRRGVRSKQALDDIKERME
jgi:hypothetical protein